MCEYVLSLASALLGASAALVGTYLTLSHQSNEAKKQRQFEQRRSEYARFIEATCKTVRDLTSASNLDHTKLENSTGLLDFSAAAGRLCLFASPSVVEKSLLISNIVTTYINKLFGYIIRAQQHKQELDAAAHSIKRLTTQEEELRQIIQLQALSPEHPKSMQWRQTLDALAELQTKSENISLNDARLKLEAYKIFLLDYKNVVPIYNELLSDMRSDLSDSHMPNIYKALKEGSDAGIKQLEQIVQQLEELVRNAERSSLKR